MKSLSFQRMPFRRKLTVLIAAATLVSEDREFYDIDTRARSGRSWARSLSA